MPEEAGEKNRGAILQPGLGSEEVLADLGTKAFPVPEFQRVQFGFARHIRDPARNPAPSDVAPARMALYRELFFNNIETCLGNGFPVLKSILAGDRWRELVQDFYARHRSKTPFFAEIPEEFLDYLQNERDERPDDPPFLRELAHYEWVELALAIDEAEGPAEVPEAGTDPLAWTVFLSELAWPLAYGFPVHRIGPRFQPDRPPAEPTCLVVYRNREDAVKFVEINPVTYRLLERLRETGPCPASGSLLRIAEELRHPDPPSILVHGAEMLRGLVEREIIGVVRGAGASREME
jgi:hypothetical protein